MSLAKTKPEDKKEADAKINNVKKSLAIFLSAAWMSLIKLFLAGNNLIIPSVPWRLFFAAHQRIAIT